VTGNWNKLGHNVFPSRLFSGLLTDLYQLTMAAGYIQNQFDARATFELFVRHLPRTRNYPVAAGLEQILKRRVMRSPLLRPQGL
jgi:nicotinic acid phosphoribosyltransferase